MLLPKSYAGSLQVALSTQTTTHTAQQPLNGLRTAHCNIQQDRIRTSRQLFAHDRGSNQRNATYRCRNIPQGVQLFIRHRNFAALAND